MMYSYILYTLICIYAYILIFNYNKIIIFINMGIYDICNEQKKKKL